MLFGDALADGQADAGAGILPARVQPLEDHENPLEVLRVDADAVVGHRQHHAVAIKAAAHVHLGRPLGVMVFQRVLDQVLRHARQFVAAAEDAGQVVQAGIDADRRAQGFDLDLQGPERIIDDGAQRHHFLGRGDAADAGIFQKVQDQPVHALGAVAGKGDEFVAVLVQLVAVAPFQQRDVGRDHAQRLAQVVAGHIGELFQLGVGPLQRLGLLAQRLFDGLTLGDVAEHHHGAGDGVPPPHGRHRIFHRKAAAVLAPIDLARHLARLPVGQRLVHGAVGLRVIGAVGVVMVAVFVQVHAHPFLSRPAQQAAGRRVHEGKAPVHVQPANALLRGAQDQFALLAGHLRLVLALGQRRLGLLARRAHGGEGLHQFPHLVAAGGRQGGIEIARGQRARRPGQLAQRPQHRPFHHQKRQRQHDEGEAGKGRAQLEETLVLPFQGGGAVDDHRQPTQMHDAQLHRPLDGEEHLPGPGLRQRGVAEGEHRASLAVGDHQGLPIRVAAQQGGHVLVHHV